MNQRMNQRVSRFEGQRATQKPQLPNVEITHRSDVLDVRLERQVRVNHNSKVTNLQTRCYRRTNDQKQISRTQLDLSGSTKPN